MLKENSIIETLLMGAAEVIPMDHFEKKIKSGEPLNIKAGFDPTAPDLHIGHAVLLLKLRQLQDLGHHVSFLIGDFTARIGDPTGKNLTRMPLGDEEIIKNARTYEAQVYKILDPKQTTVVFNAAWLGQLTAGELIKLAQTTTVARMIERDDFQKRYLQGQAIALHEFLYPLLQGYDSVVLKTDIEMGGRDQKFNLLMGRELQRHFGLDEQIVFMMPLIEGLDGVKKMSKSLNNYIGINELPEDIFGKLMSISDELMWRYMEILSAKPRHELNSLKQAVSEGLNPRDVKLDFAAEMVALFHSPEAAQKSKEGFISRFQSKTIPEDLATETIFSDGETSIAQILKQSGLTKSTSESIRLIKQGAVKLNGTKISDGSQFLIPDQIYLFEIGKHRLIKMHYRSKA